MKRIFLTVWILLLAAAPLSAAGAGDDSLDVVRAVERGNRATLSETAARPAVVARKRVPRADFYLWYSHLDDKTWGADGNLYPLRTTGLYLVRPDAAGNRDIFYTEPQEGGLWSVPAPAVPAAVSPGDECFPMLSPDGKRLYFASDGLFGMGGYDLYEATWDPRLRTWGSVRNLGLPFNSPGDDLLFCDTPDGRFSLLATNRASGRDSVDIIVMRQETAVYAPVTPAEAEELLALKVTAPDPGWIFVKHTAGPVPKIAFEEPEPELNESFSVGKEGAFASNNNLPAGLVYQIQLFVSAGKPSISQLKGVRPVYVHAQRSGKKLCAAGLFRTYSDAEDALPAVRRAGFPSAFIIAFDGGKPLSLSKAKQKESSVKVVTEEVRIVK